MTAGLGGATGTHSRPKQARSLHIRTDKKAKSSSLGATRKKKKRGDGPGFSKRLGRRLNVYWLAAQIFVDYKQTQRKERKLRRTNKDIDSDDHPSVRRLWSKVHQRNADKLLKQIQKQEGFWIKVGQYLSSRADVMPPEYLITLSSLQDGLPPKPFHDVMATLEQEFSQEELSSLESIDPAPLSTASLAQVHRATMVGEDGDRKDFVLKVQHRGVATLMRQDMATLERILRLIARLEPDADFSPIVKEYNAEVQKELDFRIEAQNMAEIGQLLQDHNIQAIVPKAVPSLVEERVLGMEYCQGFSIRNVDALDEFQVDRQLLLQRVCEAWAVQMHLGGVFNADPHPGNVLVSTSASNDNSVPVLLDFGLCKRLDPQKKLAFARLMHSSYETDVDGLLESFEEMGLKLNRYDPFEDMAAMQRSFGHTVPQSRAREVSKQKSAEYRRRMDAKEKDEGKPLRNPVDAWPAELVFFGRVTNMLRGLCSRLEVEHPYLQTMAAAAQRALQDSVPVQERAQQLVYPHQNVLDTPLQHRLQEAVHQLREQNEMVGLQLCVMSKGHVVAHLAAGVLGTANPRPITPDTLFCVFSVSKAILTIGMLRLVQDGHFGLDDAVATHWPSFGKAGGKHDITIRHVLTHQAGLANALPNHATLDALLDWEHMKQVIEQATPDHPPGNVTQYHYLTYAWICGGIMEQVTGRPYQDYLDEIFMQTGQEVGNLYLGGIPGDMDRSRLAVLSMEKPSEFKRSVTELEPPQKESENERSNEKRLLAKYRGREQLLNPSVLNMKKVREAKVPSVNGHSSAAALAAVFDSILTPASPLLAHDIVRQARQPQVTNGRDTDTSLLLDDEGASFGLGFQLHEFSLPDGSQARSLGHAGLGGSIVMALPEANLTVAFVTNQLSRDSQARKTLLGIVLDEFGLDAPRTIRL